MEFDRLERAIERINAHLTDYLAPGLPAAEIAALMEGRPYQLPADVVQLYQWHNGESSEAPLAWNLTGTANHFLPLQQALLDEKGYELRREMLELNFGEGRIPAELDAPAYIVLFEDGGGDEMFVPCWNQPAATSPIYYYDEDDEVSIAYGGVADMIRTFATCYEEGVHYLEGGQVKTDFHRLYEISNRLNPQGRWR